MTVSGNFGKLPQKDPSVKRRTKPKAITKIPKCIGKNKWEIMLLDGSKQHKSLNVLIIENSILFDEEMKNSDQQLLNFHSNDARSSNSDDEEKEKKAKG